MAELRISNSSTFLHVNEAYSDGILLHFFVKPRDRPIQPMYLCLQNQTKTAHTLHWKLHFYLWKKNEELG